MSGTHEQKPLKVIKPGFYDVSEPDDKNVLYVKVGEHAIVRITDTIRMTKDSINGWVTTEVLGINMDDTFGWFASANDLKEGGADYSGLCDIEQTGDTPTFVVPATPLEDQQSIDRTRRTLAPHQGPDVVSLTKEEQASEAARQASEAARQASEAARQAGILDSVKHAAPFSRDSLAHHPGMVYLIEPLTRVANLTAELIGHDMTWSSITCTHHAAEGITWKDHDYKRKGVCRKCGRLILLQSKPDAEHAAIDGTAISESCEDKTHAEDVIPAE